MFLEKENCSLHSCFRFYLYDDILFLQNQFQKLHEANLANLIAEQGNSKQEEYCHESFPNKFRL